jgi:RHS repeat-associated protein
MTGKGTWIYTWNGENRMISAENNYPVVDLKYAKVERTYDYMGRCITKKSSKWFVPIVEKEDNPEIIKVREKLAKTIEKIEAELEKKIAHINEKIAHIDTKGSKKKGKAKGHGTDKQLASFERQIEHEKKKAERCTVHETAKAERKIAKIIRKNDKRVAHLENELEKVADKLERETTKIEKELDKLFDCNDSHADKKIAKLEKDLVKLTEKSEAETVKIEAEIKKITGTSSGTTNGEPQWIVTNQKFVWNGTKLIAEYNESDVLQKSYTWQPVGLDLPLWVKDGENYYYYIADGNKNIRSMVDVAGAEVASYEYSLFGKVTGMSGTYASTNPFRFSSEYHDDTTGLIEYMLRDYYPDMGMWTSRDPIGEKGGYNLYGMVQNNPISKWDYLGLKERKVTKAICDCLLDILMGTILQYRIFNPVIKFISDCDVGSRGIQAKVYSNKKLFQNFIGVCRKFCVNGQT